MRVLIISPHFPPVNAPDMQRVRMLLPYFSDNRVEAEILAVEPEQVACVRDEWLMDGLPPEVPVHRVRVLGLAWAKFPGLGTLGFRAMRALCKRGDELLASKRFDLVYFSTTVFEIHVLGPRWKRKLGVPFVMDYQDPWVNNYYREHPKVRPPGGRLKYWVIDRVHRLMEREVLSECAGVTAVSLAYLIQLRERYPAFATTPFLVQPFPGDTADLRRAASKGSEGEVFDSGDGCLHWVYAGVVIPGMHGTLRAFFRALKQALDGGWEPNLRIHFIGTNYSVNALPVIGPIAAEFGLSGLIEELPWRIPYSQVLACLSSADALLVFGSDDPGYTASKIYPYILARKPLLTIFHHDSSVVTVMGEVGGGICVAFSNDDSEELVAERIGKTWFEGKLWEHLVALNEAAFAPYTAPVAVAKLVAFFQNCIGRSDVK